MLPEEIQNKIRELPQETQTLFEVVVLYFTEKINKLEGRIKELEDQKSKNSSNSSKPPSSDEFKKKPKSTRKKSGLKPGGQKGHKGDTLKKAEQVDEIIKHKVDCCENCNKDLRRQKVISIESRQVYDIPEIQIKVTEHQSEVKKCPCGHVNKSFPTGVDYSVQYGPHIKGLVVYLQDYQLLPYERTKELVKDLFGHDISQGSLYNFRQHAFHQLESFERRLKELLRTCQVAGFDETGLRVMVQRLWLHSCSTNNHVYYEVHPKRGQQAMDAINILPHFTGIAIHDFWKSYYAYNCDHGACNAHLLRDLIFIKERFEQQWADDFIDLLLKMKNLKQKAIARGQISVCKASLKKYRQLCDEIIEQGMEINPFKPPDKKSRGKYKKSPPRNLIERIKKRADDILRFFYDFRVPFDNNFSERDIRMIKVKQKISGCFRSLKGAHYFARVRSYIMTARKQNVNTFGALTTLFTDNSIAIKLTS